jgi:8-oxo-dGTP pyrophosphatase MutT (NUDIX family)
MNKPTDSVRIALFDAEDSSQFLVLAEADDPTNWKLPGGKFDYGDEQPEAAANRELGEEVGLDSSAGQIQKAGELVNDDGVSARYIFAGVIHREQLKPSAEIADTRWVTETTIPDSPNKAHMLSAVQLARSVLRD